MNNIYMLLFPSFSLKKYKIQFSWGAMRKAWWRRRGERSRSHFLFLAISCQFSFFSPIKTPVMLYFDDCHVTFIRWQDCSKLMCSAQGMWPEECSRTPVITPFILESELQASPNIAHFCTRQSSVLFHLAKSIWELIASKSTNTSMPL
jgi:hypothetical protein